MVDLKNFLVKGSPMIADIAFVRQRYGEEGLEKAMAAMQPEFAEEYRSRLLASDWYTMEFRLAILYAVDELFAKGDEHFFWEMGRNQAEHNLKNYYKAFMRLIGPAKLARVAAMFWGLIYNTSHVDVILKNNAVEFIIHDYPITEKFNCHVIRGYMHHCLEYALAGASTISGEETTCINCGDEHCVFVFRWD